MATGSPQHQNIFFFQFYQFYQFRIAAPESKPTSKPVMPSSKNLPQQSPTRSFQQSRTKTGPDIDLQNPIPDCPKKQSHGRKLSPVVSSNPHGHLQPLMKRDSSRRNPYLMEFVETPSFWCLHVDRATCTNLSTQTVELRPSKHWEILPFSFSLSFPFFFFSFLLSFLFFLSSYTNSFLFAFLFSLSHFFLLIFSFSFLFFSFWSILDRLVKGGSFLPLSSCHLCGSHFSFLFLNSFIPFYCIILHMANCEPHLQVHHMALAMWHPLNHAMYHLTPYASKT